MGVVSVHIYTVEAFGRPLIMDLFIFVALCIGEASNLSVFSYLLSTYSPSCT